MWHLLEVLPFPCLLCDERTDMHSLEKLVQRKLFVVVDGTTFLCARPISRSAEDNKVGKRKNFAPQPHVLIPDIFHSHLPECWWKTLNWDTKNAWLSWKVFGWRRLQHQQYFCLYQLFCIYLCQPNKIYLLTFLLTCRITKNAL